MTPIGSMVEMILFSLALADRFNNERRERERAQRQVVRSQANVLRLQQETNEELERRVAERTNELASANRLLRQYLERISRLQVISELGPSLVHEMKQPLAAIRTLPKAPLTLMDKQRLQAPQVSYGLNRILATIDEALELMALARLYRSRRKPTRADRPQRLRPRSRALDKANVQLRIGGSKHDPESAIALELKPTRYYCARWS